MIYTSEETLDLFRGPGTCAFCLAKCRARQPHHIRPKGHGGGSRLDIRINLISLGHPLECPCHDGFHSRNSPTVAEFRQIVARRERCLQCEIELVVNLILRLPKNPPFEVLEHYVAEMAEISHGTAKLAKRTFLEMGLDWRRVKK